MSLSRRRLLTGALALGAASAAAPFIRRAGAQLTFTGSPFTLGVASGYPLPTGVVLWTRLAPVPLQPGGGMPPEVVAVEWEVATDERMGQVVRRGIAAATPQWAHAVHVEVDGLEPARWYWYRFRAGREVSPIGRTRTAPAATAAVERFRFAYASCQQYEQGYYGAHHRMLADDLDLVVFLGDYIYESSWGSDHVRTHGAPEPHTLDDYRVRHALYKTDPDLQAAHAAYPWIVTWDDHEVENDYADDRSEHGHPREWFLARRAAAYQAYYEHMPLPARMQPRGPDMRIYTQVGWGSLGRFYMLDDRQYRSWQACVRRNRRGGSNTLDVERCDALADPQRTMLGLAQERWLEGALSGSRSQWNILAQQTLMARFDQKPGPGRNAWTDGWDGYPVARQRLLNHLELQKIANPVVIGGDVHCFEVADLKLDFDDPSSRTVASEFVTSSITSQAWPQERLDKFLPDNPHLKRVDSRYRGYARVEVTAKSMRVEQRAMDSVQSREAACSSLTTFVVEEGRPGALQA